MSKPELLTYSILETRLSNGMASLHTFASVLGGGVSRLLLWVASVALIVVIVTGYLLGWPRIRSLLGTSAARR